jgi:hypothetical protein
MVVLGAMILSVLAGLGGDHLRPRYLVAAVFMAFAIWATGRPWGSGAVAMPVLLLPGVATRGGIAGGTQLAILTLLLAAMFWANGAGRPKLSPFALALPVLMTGLLVLLAIGYGGDAQDALRLGLLGVAGVMLGACLFANHEAWLAIGCLAVPIALLALAEIAGFHNPWPHLVHADTFTSLSVQDSAHRAQSTFGHPLIAGGIFATLAALMTFHPSRWRYLIIPIVAGGALATVSRSALLGSACATAVALTFSGQARGKLLLQVVTIVVTAWVLVSQVPQLHTSIASRITQQRYVQQDIRAAGLDKLKTDLNEHTGALLVGGGPGESARQLKAIPGAYTTYFDNQYITSVYDFGLLPIVAGLALLGLALYAGVPRANRYGLPALMAVAVVFAFTDGLYWGSLGLVAWVCVGFASAADLGHEQPEHGD